MDFAQGYDLNEARMESVFIGISGLIGAGKTTLAKALAKKLNLPVYFEPVIDNAYLADFYGDMKRYSFPLQVYLLNRRFKQQQQIIWSGKGGVQDRTIYEDAVFAKMLMNGGLMDKRDYDTYITLFNNMSNFMKKPNIIIHLDVTPEESLRRIKMRSRDCESSVSLEYLVELRAAYDDFIKQISLVIPVIKVNWSEFRSTDEMATRITEEYAKLHNIRVVDFGQQPSAAPQPKTPSPTSPVAGGAGGGAGAGAITSAEAAAAVGVIADDASAVAMVTPASKLNALSATPPRAKEDKPGAGVTASPPTPPQKLEMA